MGLAYVSRYNHFQERDENQMFLAPELSWPISSTSYFGVTLEDEVRILENAKIIWVSYFKSKIRSLSVVVSFKNMVAVCANGFWRKKSSQLRMCNKMHIKNLLNTW